MPRIHTAMLALAAATLASPLAQAQSLGDVGRGNIVAARLCAECHAITPGQTSPRPESLPFERIAATPGMTELAIKVWLQTPHPTMPNLMLPAADREDVAAYIASLKPAR